MLVLPAEALELARQRDKRWILALKRVIRSSPTSGDADKARSVLKEIGALEQGAVEDSTPLYSFPFL